MKLNKIKHWPHVHVCLFDLSCWCEMYLYGAPMRVHYKKKFWDIPGLTWISDRRHDKLWREAVPVTLSTKRPESEPSEAL